MFLNCRIFSIDKCTKNKMLPVKLSWTNISSAWPGGDLGKFGVPWLFLFFLRTYCYFEYNLKEGFFPLFSPFSSKPSVILA